VAHRFFDYVLKARNRCGRGTTRPSASGHADHWLAIQV